MNPQTLADLGCSWPALYDRFLTCHLIGRKKKTRQDTNYKKPGTEAVRVREWLGVQPLGNHHGFPQLATTQRLGDVDTHTRAWTNQDRQVTSGPMKPDGRRRLDVDVVTNAEKAKMEMAGGHKLRWQSFEGWTKTVDAMVATPRAQQQRRRDLLESSRVSTSRRLDVSRHGGY